MLLQLLPEELICLAFSMADFESCVVHRAACKELNACLASAVVAIDRDISEGLVDSLHAFPQLTRLKLRLMKLQHSPIRRVFTARAKTLFEDMQMERLAHNLPAHLLDLDLSGNGLQTGACLLGPALTRCGSLRHLNLEYNNIDGAGAVAIGKGLCSCLRSLNLAGNAIHEPEALRCIVQGLPCLETLDLWGNGIDSQGARVVSEVMRGLKHLQLGSNRIGDLGVYFLSRSLTDRLQSLGLSNNALEPEDGFLFLAHKLTLCAHLRFLNLAENDVGALGAAMLSANLNRCTVTHLDLSCNSLGTEGALVVALGARGSCLECLSLRRNGIGPVGFRGIAECLPECALQHIDLGGNPMSVQDMEHLLDALPEGGQLNVY